MREELLREQWLALRSWLDDADVLDRGELPTGLGAWSVTDLVAHLGLGLGMLTEITPAEPGTEPMSFGRYVGHYPPAAEAIAAGTRDLAAELQSDLLAGLDRIAAEAFAAIEGVDWPVVLGRRGPLTYADYLQTRLLELVVHGDDLERAIDARTSPVLRGSRRVDRGDSCRRVRGALGEQSRRQATRWPGSDLLPGAIPPTTRTCRCCRPSITRHPGSRRNLSAVYCYD